MTNFKIGDSVSFTDDKTQQFDVFEVVAINNDGTMLLSDLEGVFSPDLLTIVHTY
jgi:UTP:GlnB (protein PII) uridylyltransferase|tara:strand:- start:1165 stop:1329 length:165 start_codon:yes stop_codon:yes gene_type:complete